MTNIPSSGETGIFMTSVAEETGNNWYNDKPIPQVISSVKGLISRFYRILDGVVTENGWLWQKLGSHH